jgi:hypothetical protein
MVAGILLQGQCALRRQQTITLVKTASTCCRGLPAGSSVAGYSTVSSSIVSAAVSHPAWPNWRSSARPGLKGRAPPNRRAGPQCGGNVSCSAANPTAPGGPRSSWPRVKAGVPSGAHSRACMPRKEALCCARRSFKLNKMCQPPSRARLRSSQQRHTKKATSAVPGSPRGWSTRAPISPSDSA